MSTPAATIISTRKHRQSDKSLRSFVDIDAWRVQQVPGLTVIGTSIEGAGSTLLELVYVPPNEADVTTKGVHMFSNAQCPASADDHCLLRSVTADDLDPQVTAFRFFIRVLREQMKIEPGSEADTALQVLSDEAATEIPLRFKDHICTSFHDEYNKPASMGFVQTGKEGVQKFKAWKDPITDVWEWPCQNTTLPVGYKTQEEVQAMFD